MALKLALLLSTIGAGAAGAQGAGDHIDPALGRILAERWCTECHVVTPLRTNSTAVSAAPDFTAIANDSTSTELGLTVFLKTPHATMPDIRLSRDQIAQIASYIPSLKGR